VEAAGRFAGGDEISEIAQDLRVTPGSVRWWRRAWRNGGERALRSGGPASRERLGPRRRARLEQKLGEGPLARGFAGDRRWMLGRIRTLTGRLFHVGFTVEGAGKLLRRRGWSCQVPVRQAMERDEQAVAAWKAGVWPRLKVPRALGAFICLEGEAGRGLSPPGGRTRAPRGACPVVRVRGAGGGRVSIAGVVCCRRGGRPCLFCQLRVCRRRRGEPGGLAWNDYRDLVITARRGLSAPLAWCRDNLSIRLAPELAEFAAGNKARLRAGRLRPGP
jgi:transposase